MPHISTSQVLEVNGSDFDFANCPIFYQPWWLDAACGKGKWKVCTARNKDGKPVGVLVHPLQKIAGLAIVRTPPFTPYLGVWLDYSDCSNRNISRYSFENEAISDLLRQLPSLVWYHQVHPYQLENWLPFHWKGFRQTTRYTYVFEQLDAVQIWQSMKDKTRNAVRKAEASGVTIRETNSLDAFLPMYRKTFDRQGQDFSSKERVFKSLHDEIQKHQKGKILIAVDAGGNPSAGLYMIWDKHSAYCWQLGTDTELAKNGAVQLLIWHSILEATKLSLNYNFEGSMLPHIEPVFRAFGAERKPVFQIRKFGNRLIEAFWVMLKG
ncbi:MAG: GNAT family N-acetyltransferase [Saprospiraceae bacterium]|nr:GNAT family N-acetyltransferase [Saprospiraceae bacterium]